MRAAVATTDPIDPGVRADSSVLGDVGVPADRGVGEFAVVEALPDIAVVVLAAVTHLADPWFLFGLLALGYWLADDRIANHPRAAGATTIAIVACGYAAVALGKVIFAVPRPPSAATVAVSDVPTWLPTLLVGWFEGQLVADGFGFPSGHATAAVVAYGSLALLCDRIGTLRSRVVLAAVLVVGVSLSRVAIGVHYLADVVAGVLLGVAIVAGGLWLAGGPWFADDESIRSRSTFPPDPSVLFLSAAFVSLLAAGVALGGGHGGEVVEAAIGVGTGVGGALGWRLADEAASPVPGWLVVPALLVTGGLWIGAFAVGSLLAASTLVTALATLLATTVAVLAVLALPSLVGRSRVG